MKYKYLLLIILFLVSCDLPWDAGPQPIYLDKKEYNNQFNILGIIRPGNISGVSLSFVHLETTYDHFNIPDSLEIGDANVRLIQYNDSVIIDTLNMVYTNFDGIFFKKEYRSPEIDTVDSILSGKTFGISCRKLGYPELISKTTIPQIPVIVNNNIIIQSGKIKFDILRDENVHVYDVYLVAGSKELMERHIRPDIGDTNVELNFKNSNAATGKIIIYAYDLKLSEYITYNVIIKPQTYQNRYSTVENGFGCFGSLNILEKNIVF